MNPRRIVAIALALSILPTAALAGRGFAGGGGFSRPSGGFDFHNDAGGMKPGQTQTHSSTSAAGTNRTTSVTDTGSGYTRSTTANNGNYNRTSGGSVNTNNGNVNHYSNANGPNGSQHSNTSGNYNTGNYSHNGSGNSNYYGSYSDSGSGNRYNHTYSGSGTATNSWGQTYHTNTYANNGYVYHGATINNPVYVGPAWGWNGGVAWYPAPYYWGGGFWGAFAIGAATSAVVYGSIVAANNQTYTSYQVQQSSPGAKLLQSYNLTQVPCVNNGLVVIYGQNNSVICAKPNALVAAGNYSVNSQTLTLTSEKPAT